MDKTQKLEKRWFKYRAQKIILSTALILALLLSMLIGYFSFFKQEIFNDFFKKEKLSEASMIMPNVKPDIEIIKTTLLEENNISVSASDFLVLKEEKIEEEIKKETLSLEPVIPIVDMENEKFYSSKRKVKKASVRRVVHAKKATYLTASELKNTQGSRDTTKLKKINLTSSSKNYIETMKLKFSKRKTARDALLLAKAFYRRGQYKASEKWALRANKLDSDNAESWIIFASSKAKMGQKNEAIKILFTYYQRSKSTKVRAVIDKIKIGQI